jgi:hypothetical protein
MQSASRHLTSEPLGQSRHADDVRWKSMVSMGNWLHGSQQLMRLALGVYVSKPFKHQSI